jgi:hypothetical protein
MLKGEYNKHSQAQGAVVDACSPLLARAGREVPLTPDNTLTIAEWGCSHGGNSIAPVLLILQQLQQRLQQLPANNRDHFRPLQVRRLGVLVLTPVLTPCVPGWVNPAAYQRRSLCSL